MIDVPRSSTTKILVAIERLLIIPSMILYHILDEFESLKEYTTNIMLESNRFEYINKNMVGHGFLYF